MIDTTNRWLVGVEGSSIVIHNAPFQLSPDAALVLAAYLVALAEPKATFSFDTVLQEVQNA